MLGIAVVGLAVDLYSKNWAFELLPLEGQRREVLDGFFFLAHVRNPGMAWSLFQNVPSEVWVAIRTGLSALLVWLYLSSTRPTTARYAHLAFGLLLGGALGNLYDNIRAPEGKVRDFLLFYFGDWPFPVFNVADAMITCGAPLLFLHLAAEDRAAAREKAAAEAAARAAAAQASADAPRPDGSVEVRS
jgi:signal peptidase II